MVNSSLLRNHIIKYINYTYLISSLKYYLKYQKRNGRNSKQGLGFLSAFKSSERTDNKSDLGMPFTN